MSEQDTRKLDDYDGKKISRCAIEFDQVSVVVPAFQASTTIQRALLSIARQTMKPKEVIVIDDGSDDKTAEVAEKFTAKMNNISLKVFCQENRGAGAARNVGIQNAEHDLIAFLDADDEWLPTKIERSVQVLNETGSDFVSHDFIMVDNKVEKRMYCARHFKKTLDPASIVFIHGNIANTTVLVRREQILQVGGFDETLRSGQDYELWLRIVLQDNTRFNVFDEALTRYYITDGSISSQVDERRKGASKILLRHASALRFRSGWALPKIMLRIVIIHFQAATKFHEQKNFFGAVLALAHMPILTVEMFLRIYTGTLLWVWVVVISILYCFQFRVYFGAIKKVIGFG